MPNAASTRETTSSSRHFPVAGMIAAGVAGLLLAMTIALWAHYGSAVFYEMLLTGLAACF
jgi:hypothetical protein